MTGTLTFGGIDYNTTGAQTYEADHIVMSGADPDFKTDDDNISFKDGGITLATTSNLTVDTTSSSAGNILIEGAIAGTSDGTTTTVTLEAGSGSVAVAGMGTDIGNVTIDGGGGITLNGSITTAGGNIDINDAVTLDTADIILTTANGTVDFASTVNADGAEALTIRSGTGNVGFSGVIGGTGSLGALTINATSDSRTGDADIAIVDIGDSDTVGAAATNIGNTNTELITLSGTTFKHGAAVYTTKADDVIKLTRTAGAGNATFTLSNASLEFAGGNIKLSDGVDLVANTGNKALTVLGVRGTSYEDVTLTTSGTLTVGTGGIGSGTQIEDVSLDGTSIVLKGNITTAGATVGNTNNVGDVDFDGAVTIDGAITITTDVSGSTVNDGKIDFATNTINAEGTDTDSLTLTSGSGTITLGGAVGGTTDFHFHL